MIENSTPRQYPDWQPDNKAEDAAYNFGYHLIKYCRTEGIKSLPTDLSPSQREKAIHAIDVSLHNVLDLLEGFFLPDSGKDHAIGYALQTIVLNAADRTKEIERIELTGQDMPIGYWKWALDNEFR